LAQGLGGALSEEFRYDERGEPLATTFADYLMLTAREMPALDVLITEDAPAPGNPLGVKGAGEGGVNAVGAALTAAIDAALGPPGESHRPAGEPGAAARAAEAVKITDAEARLMDATLIGIDNDAGLARAGACRPADGLRRPSRCRPTRNTSAPDRRL